MDTTTNDAIWTSHPAADNDKRFWIIDTISNEVVWSGKTRAGAERRMKAYPQARLYKIIDRS